MFRGNAFRFLAVAGFMLAVSGMITAQASVSGTLSYSSGFTNVFPLPIPAGLSICVGVSYTISGSATITGPGGGSVASIGMSGGSVSLSEVGTYNVSESYHIELIGTPPVGDPVTLTDDASDSWSFSNSVPGSTGDFSVSSGLSVSSNSEGNVSASASESGGCATLTSDLLPGESVSAGITGVWTVNTSISVEPPSGTGSIEVSANLEEATFTLSGGYSGSGMSWTTTDAPAGVYTITYGTVPDYRTPLSETQALAPNETISFHGAYEPETGTIEVHTNLDEATFSISGRASYSGSGKSWMTAEVPVGEYAITYHDVPGYLMPSPETSILVDEGTISFSGIYTPIPPPEIYSVEVFGSPARTVGAIITVVLIGAPDGVAAFSIANIAQDTPMPESEDSSGTYIGQHIAAEGMNVRDAKVIVILTSAEGIASADESMTVSIITAPWDVNSDGIVDLLDVKAVGANLGKDPIPELDVNNDGAISVLDVILVGVHFGEEYSQ